MDESESANPGGFPARLDRPDGKAPVSDGAAPTLPDAGSLLDMDGVDRAIQETADRYVGVKEIARGGMGRILLAFDSTLDREVIIKELLPPSEAADVTRGAEFRPFSGAHPLLRRFLQEARITGSLEHPSIVPVYELGRREDDTPYYTMKVVHGKTLSKAIQAASSLRERLLLLPHFVNLCQAIAYAHSRGVIHRDLKPDNVMIGEYGETVVLDWGLARKLGGADVYEAVDGEGVLLAQGPSDSGGDVTLPGAVMGTPLYMSPEQAAGDRGRVNERTDVYALGVILYEIITGKKPYSCTTVKEAVEKITREAPIPISNREPNAPPALAAVCAHAMEKDPAKRYASAVDLAEEISRFLSGALVKAYDYRFTEQVRLFIARYKGRLMAALVALVLLAGTVTVSYIQVMRQRDAATAARAAAEQALGSEAEARRHAEEQQEIAEHARLQEEVSRKEAEQAREGSAAALYNAQIALASSQVKNGAYERARQLLAECVAERRDWEWGRLQCVCNQDYRTYKQSLEKNIRPVLSGYALDTVNARVITEDVSHSFSLWNAMTGEVFIRSLVPLEGDDVQMYVSPGGGWRLERIGHVGRIFPAVSDNSAVELDVMNHWLWSVAFSADDSTLAVRSAPEQVTVFNLNEKKLQCNFEELGLNQARLSHDGAWVACVTAAGVAEDPERVSLDFRDARSGEEIVRIQESGLTALEFAPGEALLATGAQRGEIAVWQPGEDTPLWRVSVDAAPVMAIGFSNTSAVAPENETVLAVISSTGAVWTGGLKTGTERGRFQTSGGRTGALALSPNGKLVAVGAFQYVYVYEANTGILVRRLDGHEKQVLHVAFSNDGELLYSITSADIKIWKVDVPDAAGFLEGSDIFSAALLPDGEHIRTVAAGSGLQEWGLRSGLAESVLQPVSPAFDLALLNPTGSCLLLDSAQGLMIYNIGEEKILAEIPRLHLQSTSLAFSPCGRWLAVLAGDFLAQTALLSVYDLSDGTTARTIQAYRRTESWDLTCAALAFSPDGATLALAILDRLTLYDIPGGHEKGVYTIPPLQERMNKACFNEQGNKIAVTMEADSLYVLDMGREENSLQIDTAGNRIVSIAFNKDSSRLAVGDDEGVVNLWNTVEGVQLTHEPLFDHEVQFLRFTPDERALLAGDGEQVAVLRAFPWREEDLPGNACTPLEMRLEAVKTYQECFAPDWSRCQWRMHELEDALLKAGGVNDAVMERIKTTACPDGGVYTLSEGSTAPACSLHGRLHNAAHLLARVCQFENAPGHANSLLKESLIRALPESCISLGNLTRQWQQRENCHEEAALIACDLGLRRCPHDEGLAEVKMAYLLDRKRWDEALALLPEVEGRTHHYPGLEPKLALGLAKRGGEEDLRMVCDILMNYYGNYRGNEFPREALDLLRRSPHWATMKEARMVEKFLLMDRNDWKRLPWHDSLDTALKEAKTRNCLVFVTITIPDSGALRNLRETILSNPSLSEFLTEHFVLVQVDAMEQQEVGPRLGVSDLPALVVLDAEENVLRQENYNFSISEFCWEFLSGFDKATRLNDWCIIGLFGPEGCAEIETSGKSGNLDFSQTWPSKEGEVQWRAYSCPPVFPNVCLPKLYSWSPQSVAYAYGCFDTKQEMVIEPELDLWEGGELWIDGVLLAKRAGRNETLSINHKTMTLSKGRHHVFIKVAGRWYGSFRVELVRDARTAAAGFTPCPLPELPPLSIANPVGANTGMASFSEGSDAPNTVHLTINKNDILREWREHYGEILAALNPQPFFEDGKLVGIRAENVEKIALLANYGFKNGDIVTSVNGYEFGGEKSVLEIAELTEGSDPYVIKIKRDQEEYTFVVHVE